MIGGEAIAQLNIILFNVYFIYFINTIKERIEKIYKLCLWQGETAITSYLHLLHVASFSSMLSISHLHFGAFEPLSSPLILQKAFDQLLLQVHLSAVCNRESTLATITRVPLASAQIMDCQLVSTTPATPISDLSALMK